VSPLPASVQDGESVDVTVNVANLGNQDVPGDVIVTLEDLTDPGVIGSATIFGGLTAGSATAVIIPWNTTGASIGDHSLSANHDFLDDSLGNNADTTIVSITPAITDLAITSVVPAPASVLDGESVDVTVNVANLGNQDAPGDVLVTLEDLADPGVIGSATIFGGLTAGSATAVIIPWNTAGASIGDHSISASHDLLDDDLGNNADTALVAVSAATTDLAVTSVVPASPSVLSGDSVDVTVNVANLGNQDIPGDVLVTLEDLTDPGVIGSATIVGGLTAGLTTAVIIPWNTAGASIGEHSLSASHDLLDDDGSNDANSAQVAVIDPLAIPIAVTFQRGVDGYTGTVDTYLQQDRATTDHGDFDELDWDLGTGRDQITLIRFDDIFGLSPSQIPEGAVISSATLTYSDFNDG
jgi:hypothetical protein